MSLSRSQQMSRIGSKDTKPEVLLRKELWARGRRYRLHLRDIPGKPDLAFKAQCLVVFVDGCFWHGCPVHYVPPRTRQDYWSSKLSTNVRRDSRRIAQLTELQWSVRRIWACEIRQGVKDVADHVEEVLDDKSRLPKKRYQVLKVTALEKDSLKELRQLIDVFGNGADILEERDRKLTQVRDSSVIEWRKKMLT